MKEDSKEYLIRFCLRFVFLTLTVLTVSPSITARQTANSQGYPPEGKLIDVGGWRIHLNCTGTPKAKAPTVVFESGSGDFSFDWHLVQPEVSKFTRVCSYDRAGSGWSDLGPRPRTMKQIAYELHTALNKAGLKGNYVMVGQSIGGLLIRTFANLYPKEVAGMVLVDSTHEDTQLNINGKIQRMRELSEGRTLPEIHTKISDADKILSAEEKQQVESFLKQIGAPKIRPPYDRLPPEVQKIRLWALSQPNHYMADSDPFWGEEFAAFYAARKTQRYPLGNIPLIVLTRGKNEYTNDENGKQLDVERKRMQSDLLNLSSNSQQIIAQTSGHHIQLDDPQLVINSIRRIVETCKQPAKRRSLLSSQ
jgi:pimeloyl-ACP methyl ester carboxylesterase